DYYLDQVGADYYLTAAGEPPGVWAGQGAKALGLRGQVGGDKASAKTMRALFHYGIGAGRGSARLPAAGAEVPAQGRLRAGRGGHRQAGGDAGPVRDSRGAAGDPPEGAGGDGNQHALLRHDVQRREVGVA